MEKNTYRGRVVFQVTFPLVITVACDKGDSLQGRAYELLEQRLKAADAVLPGISTNKHTSILSERYYEL